MNKGRIIALTIVSVAAAGALSLCVFSKYKAAGLARPVDIEDALIVNTPVEGDELYLRVSTDDMFQYSGDLWTWSYVFGEEDGDYITVPVISEGNIENQSLFYASVSNCDPGMADTVAKAYRDYYQSLLDRLTANREKRLSEDPDADVGKIDEYIGMISDLITDEIYEQDKASVTSFMLTVKAAPNYDLIGYIAGVAAVFLGVVLLYLVLGIRISGKKLAIGSLAFLILAVISGAFILRKEIATMASIREYAPGLYICKVTNDYKLDEFLDSGITDSDTLIREACKKLLGGFPISVDAHHFGCSSFSCENDDGAHLFGRNYDYLQADGMVIYSDQEGAYASIAMCDLSWLDMAGENMTVRPDSFFGRLVLRGACAIMCVDGFNDQGLGISILSLDYREQRMDTDKPDTLDLLAIRAILDKCANTDEAVDFLSSYDVHSMYDKDFHLFITDKSGKSVVAEWVDDELTVTEIDHVTNYNIATHSWDDEWRFVTLQDKLAETEGILSVDEALDLLKDAAQDSETVRTEWSCVYDLDHFVLYIYSDQDRDNVYIITPESFGVKDS